MTYLGLGIFEPREAEAAAAADCTDQEQGEEEQQEEEEEELQQEAHDDDGGQDLYDEGQFEEQYDAEAWSQMAYAMPMQWAAACSPCSGAAMFWPAAAAAGAAKRLSAHAGSIGHHRGSLKQRFCATFPSVSRCRHGAACAFAHSREEVSAPLLSPEEETYVPDALTEEFFTDRFKVYWCPIGGQHDWHSCMYAHTYQDVRRPPSIGYGHQLCPYWNKKETSLPYSQRCPLGPRCPYAHGAKEQLYHPGYFRTLVCRDLQRRRCPRGQLCAFFHKPADERATGADSSVDYNSPLDKAGFPEGWYSYFMNPPRFQEVCDGMDGEGAMAAFPMSAAPKDEFVQTPRTRAHSDDESLDAPEAPKGKGKGKGAGGKGAGKGARRAAAMNAYAAMGGMPFGAAAAYRNAMSACGGHELDMAWGSGMNCASYNSDYPAYAGMGYLGGSWDASYPMYAPSRGF